MAGAVPLAGSGGGYYDDVVRAVRVSAAGQVLDATPLALPPTRYTPSTGGLQLAGQNGQWLVTRCIYHDDAYGTSLAGQRIGGTVSLAAGGEYLVAGPDWSSSTTARARRVGLDGPPVGASFTVPGLQLATDGSEFDVVWVEDYVNLVGSRMTATGTLLTPAGTTLVAGSSEYNQSALAHDGTQWRLEWGVSDQLHTVRISAAGAVLDAGGGPLLPVSIGGNINTAYGVTLAGRPGGGVLVLWHDHRVALGYDANVWTLPVSAANAAGVERCVSTGTRNQRSPDLAPGPGDTGALVFVGEAANDRRVLLRLLDEDGHPTTASAIEVASGPTIGRASIAWNGSLYLVVCDSGASGLSATQIRGRGVHPDGSFVDAQPFDLMPGFSPDVEALGEDFLVACAPFDVYPQQIFAWMRIVDGPTGAFQNASTRIGGDYVSAGPRVRHDGQRWIVTYHSHWSHDNTASDAVYNFVSPDGTFTPARNPASTSGGSGTPDVAFSGSRYPFVWRNNSLSNANNYIAGRIMNADGTFPAVDFVIAEAPGRQLMPVVAWDGGSFLTVWEDQRNQGSFFAERTDLYGARVSEGGVVLDPAAFPVHVGPHGDAGAALLARLDGHALVASARFTTTPPFDSYRVGLTYLGVEAALDVDDGAGGALSLRSAPNPFRGSAEIAYSLPRPGAVRLAVHDLQGRVVRVLKDGVAHAAGRHLARWDGRGADGARVAPGGYLVALRTVDGARAQRVVVLER